MPENRLPAFPETPETAKLPDHRVLSQLPVRARRTVLEEGMEGMEVTTAFLRRLKKRMEAEYRIQFYSDQMDARDALREAAERETIEATVIEARQDDELASENRRLRQEVTQLKADTDFLRDEITRSRDEIARLRAKAAESAMAVNAEPSQR